MSHDDSRHFVVVDGYQLHRDLGERLGLKARLSKSKWREIRETYYPGKPVKDTEGKKIIYFCPGDLCPAEYQLPADWDAQGILPPRKRPKLDAETEDPKDKPAEGVPMSSTDTGAGAPKLSLKYKTLSSL